MNIIDFREINESDLPMMRNWIKSNIFVKQWYYYNKIPRLSTLWKQTINRLKIAGFKEHIILLYGKPIGYIQSYNINGWGYWTRRVKIHENTVGLDYYIGDINYIHKGYGSQIINEYIKSVVKKQNYDYVMISPNPENIANCKLCEKCGFSYQKTVNCPYKTSKHKEAIYLKSLKD